MTTSSKDLQNIKFHVIIFHTDASERGIGLVLSQNNGRGEEKLGLYYSRKLSPQERKYIVTELECLAVVDSVLHFAVFETSSLLQTTGP